MESWWSMPELPYNREAEESVTGAVFINPECYYEVSRVLSPGDFYIHRLAWIWEIFATLTASYTAIDLLTVTDELSKRGQLAEAGGASYLTGLISNVPSSLNAVEYAEIVREHASRRAGILLANQIAQKAYDESAPFDLGAEALAVATAARGTSKRVDTATAAGEMIDLIQNPLCMTTGISDIDEKIGGLFPQELSVLGGYQGTGKSAAKLQGARKNAEAGRRVLLIDLEMSAAQTWFRMSCGDLGVDMNRVRSNRVGADVKGEIINYAAELAERYKDNIVIYQAPMTPADILSAAMIERPDIIYVDVLKNMAGKPNRESPQGWYDFCMNFLRINVAQNKAIGAHVQVLHHINRAASRETRQPTIHDLMFAGESDADAIFLLYRKPDDYEVSTGGAPKTVVPIEWIVGKSRFGWTGQETINFQLVKQSFYGMSGREK
jgi:replicative DNA helicase